MSLVGSVFQGLEVMPFTEVRKRTIFLDKDYKLIVNIKGIFEVSKLKRYYRSNCVYTEFVVRIEF